MTILIKFMINVVESTERICFVLGLLFTIHSISQEVVVQPYLQKLTDQGVVFMGDKRLILGI